MSDSNSSEQRVMVVQQADSSMASLQADLEGRRDESLAQIQAACDALHKSVDERMRVLREKVQEAATKSLSLVAERRGQLVEIRDKLQQGDTTPEQITEIEKQYTELQCGAIMRSYQSTFVSLPALDGITSTIQSLGEVHTTLLPAIDLSKCSVEEIDVPKGKNSSFTVVLRDGRDQMLGGCADVIKVEVVSAAKGKAPTQEIITIAESTTGGCYTIKYSPKHVATYKITISVEGKQFPGSPYSVQPYWRDYTQLGKDIKMANGFTYPWGVACGPTDEIIVTVPHKLQIIDRELQPLKDYGSEGSGQGQFRGPAGLAFYGTSPIILAVSDCRNHRIQKFTYTTNSINPLAVIGKKGDKDLEFNLPRGLVFTSDGSLVVCDSDNHRIQVLSRNNKFVRAFGEKGAEPGQFNEPYDVAIRDETILVTDRLNHRVQCFTMTGRFSRTLNIADNQFPRGIFVSADNAVVITTGSGGTDKVLVYKDGEKLFSFGKKGREPGEFNLPMGVSMDNEGRVIVTDHWNKRMVVLT